jgi:8-oxo-dGTP pyrophosphatase MutT (NUDIX family)
VTRETTTAPAPSKALTEAGAFRALARVRLPATPVVRPPDADGRLVLAPSDYDLNPDFLVHAPPAAARPAAVLVPVVGRDPLTVLFTLRTPHLKAHAGQVSFPGGKAEPHDAGPVDTALREAEEEVGLARHLVEPLGFLDTYRTGTGFAVTPLVALVDPALTISPDPSEVAEVFEVPLSFLMEPANARLETRYWRGADRRYYALTYATRDIWGATAGMLRNMRERLFSS